MSTTKKTDASAKTRPRVIFNTFLLLIAAVIFFVTSIYFAGFTMARSENAMKPVSNGLGLCFDELDGGQATENEYICSARIGEDGKNEPAVDANDYALYAHNDTVMVERIVMQTIAFATIVIGLMFSIASLVGAIVYWNHNRA